MIGDGILLRDDGKYEVFVQIQDGTENCGLYDDEKQARESWASVHKSLNGCQRDLSEVGLFTIKPVIQQQMIRIK